jgi:energy-coupling factor transport system ATP-binding protein
MGSLRLDAISNINLDISSNEIIVISGKTGSGKTTLVQHFNLLLQPSKGSITIFDKVFPSKKEKVNPIRRRVGLVFQFPEYQLFADTVIKDIAFGPSNFKDTKKNSLHLAQEAAKMLNIDESYWNMSPFELSGGYARRVAIAGILAMQPEVMIFDEPTRGLDPSSRLEIIEIIKKLKEDGKIVIIVTHDMDLLLNLADRVLVMSKGKIVFDGGSKELFNSSEFASFSLDYPSATKLYFNIKDELKLKDYLPLSIEELASLIEGEYLE